ncbi:MAG TPA: hypothetical protein VHK69_17240 [Chitinophagaceae bacterium]|jgi:hypothetical protein|nr:hypothetical protein [Chitinophagaceae bacterium]
MSKAEVITDPLGAAVHILAGFCPSCTEEQDKTDIFDNYTDVIRRPALLIESGGGPQERYYYRSIGWHCTLLVVARYQNAEWQAAQCILNPTPEYLSGLLQHGRQLL